MPDEQPKRPVGRPRLPPELKAVPKTKPRNVRLTDVEWDELKARGVRGGPGTLADWLAAPRKGEKT